MRNVKLIVSYDGSEFAGWQTQPGCRTVQETLEQAIASAVGGGKVHANASGRTDAGVHALGQVVNFRTEADRPGEVWRRSINFFLPPDLIVREAAEASPSFDANRDAVKKLYRYVIHDGPVPDVFLRKYAFRSKWRLDDAAMREACQPLLGQHDFHSFETDWPNRETSVRTITRIGISRLGEYVWLDVEADGFLYNMVRAIAGTLINVGRGYWPASCVDSILRAEDRAQAGPTAPPEGLYLVRVTYGN